MICLIWMASVSKICCNSSRELWMTEERLRQIMEETAREVAEEWSGPKRDPERIDSILSKLREVWMRDTDMRFGQLVYNLYWLMPETKKIGMNGIDMFNVEDDVFERFLDRTVKEGWQSAEDPQA